MKKVVIEWLAVAAAGLLLYGLCWLLGGALATAVHSDQIGRQRQAEYDRVYKVGMACPCRCTCKACPCVSEVYPMTSDK